MIALIFMGWAAWIGFAPAPPVEPVAVVVHYETHTALTSAYSCDPPAPMFPCNTTRWGSDPMTSGAACPVAWKLRRVMVDGIWYVCDDTPRHDFIYGLPHIDLRLSSHSAAVTWGIREIEVQLE